ncbi:SAMP-activating enzyme E1 [Haloarcula montana]|uniref:SAMP-activating enzyme E1 n=1 Tax=Haloarcula montana TaxID=3111776 RepID=UPI002D780FF4|nr:molybdopterin-synthase adenylyltransferase MoeB [Haloarcula sp. GH36]
MRPDLDPEQLDRYSRHIIMDDVGPDGQAALLDTAVLVVGAGGLGSPVLQYLAAAGIGRLGIVDDDTVERSNLQRQVIHRDDDIGRPKVESAREFVTGLNPDVTVDAHETRLTADNAADLVDRYDIVVDASDNFATRFLVNDTCTLSGTPFSHGAVFRFEGQVTTFSGEGPCYRCLFPQAPPEGTVPDCATAGVLGVLPGTIGCLQATEVVKLAMEYGESLDGRLLAYDAADMSVDEVPIAPDPTCPVCGEDPAIDRVADASYDGRCSLADD